MRRIISIPLVLPLLLLLAGTGCDVDKLLKLLPESAPVRDAVLDAESTVELPLTYVNEEYGFSFNYGKDWVFKDQSKTHELVKGWVFAIPNEMGKPEATIIAMVIKKDPKLLRYSKSGWEEYISIDHEGKKNKNTELLEFEKLKFDGEDCVYLLSRDKSDSFLRTEYHYNYGDKAYTIGFTTHENKYEKYLPVWNAVLKSYQK